jgi:hypothetical protein
MRVRLIAFVVVALAACSGSGPTSSSLPSPTVASSRLEAEALVTFNQIRAGQFAVVRAKFDSNMLSALSEAQLKAAWDQYVTMFGNFQSQGEPHASAAGPLTVVNIPLVMSKLPGQARMAFDADGKIAGLFFLRTGV